MARQARNCAGLWGTNIADLSAAQVEQAKNALKTRNMSVIGLATPFYKCDLIAEGDGEAAGPMHLAAPRGMQEQMDLLRRCIRLAHEFETPFLRVFSFWRKQALTPELEEQIIDAFDAPVNLAAQEGITLILENEHACYIGTGAEAGRVLDEFQSKNFRACWDPGNAFSAGEKAFPDGYEAVKSYVAHVHVKDARVVETEHGLQPQWCVMGEGEIDWPGQFAALRSAGYNGWLSLETHFVPKIGSGADGKGTNEDGSRLCLEALQKMLAF